MKSTALLLTALLTYLLSGCCNLQYERQKYAETIIERIEDYKTKKNQLPTSVSEIGFIESEDSPAFYEQTTDSTYIVWYGLSLGESRTYNSTFGWSETE
ncbi:MAG: hypothetical protein JXR07_20210 [Reichenbachiella sp.]